MTARSPSRRGLFSATAATIIVSCYGSAALVGAVVPGLRGANRTLAVGVLLGCLAGTAAWFAAPRLSSPAPPQLPEPPVTAAHPETERLERRLRFDTQLERALDAAVDEHAAFAVAGRALDAIPPAAPGELLLAGEKRRNLVQVAESGPDGEGPGCPVIGVDDCPAIRNGRTLRFASADDLDACPHLADRVGPPCAALCVPVRVVGEPRGVLHRTAPLDAPPGDLEVSYLESLAAKLDARLSVLRLSPSGATEPDPSCGLHGYDALLTRIEGLRRSLTPFALAQCDIDGFGAYAQRHGEPIAATALEALGRAALRCLRPDDLLGHSGGDELLAVFPDTSAADARRALERLREELVLELATSELPPFTVSFGVAEPMLGQDLADMLLQVDAATTVAKNRGRNRAVLAADPGGEADTGPEHR